MMEIDFYKYQGNGNDFIIIDNRKLTFDGSENKLFKKWCHRRFGIGADGVIFLQDHDGHDFEMKYYNADGNESTMCGNGGRCIIKFAHHLGIIENQTSFLAIDGPHKGKIDSEDRVELKMIDVGGIQRYHNDYIINTGSPHYVCFVKDLSSLDIYKKGRDIRYEPEFQKEGINVNFVEIENNRINVRTYERGVEDETYSCGTGVVATALVTSYLNDDMGKLKYEINTLGGLFEVTSEKISKEKFNDIWLIADAQFVFKGKLELE